MNWVGRIIAWSEGSATVEVGLHQECVSGSCSDCHASAAGKLTIQTPWNRPWFSGQRVLVSENRGAFRTLQWLAFLAAFTAALGIGQALFPAARPVLNADGSASSSWTLKMLLVVCVLAGALSWRAARAWARRRPQYKVQPLEASKPARFWQSLRSGAPRPGSRGAPLSSAAMGSGSAALGSAQQGPLSGRAHAAAKPAVLVPIEEIRQVDL